LTWPIIAGVVWRFYFSCNAIDKIVRASGVDVAELFSPFLSLPPSSFLLPPSSFLLVLQ
jgi:hypothetical protein